MKRLLVFVLLVVMLIPAFVDAQGGKDCDPAKTIKMANGVKSTGDHEKDLASLANLRDSINAQIMACNPVPETPKFAPDDAGTRKNPVPLGMAKKITFTTNDDEKIEFWMVIVEVKRGKEAKDFLEAQLRYLELSDSNREYTLVHMRVVYPEEGSSDAILSMTDYNFKGYTNKQMFQPRYLAKPDLEADMFPGATLEGWVTEEVFIDDPAPLLVFNEEVFFATTP